MRSLRTRLLLATSLTLLVFLALGGLSLSRAYADSARLSQLERMQAIVYALLGSAETNAYGELSFDNTHLPDLRLDKPQSGLEAALFNESSTLLWGSPSLSDNIAAPGLQPVGEWRFGQAAGRFVLLFGMSTADEGGKSRRYTLMLLEDSHAFEQQQRQYQRSLLFWLGGAAAALLLLQGVVMRWSLRPLRRLVRELRDIENGRLERIEGVYPHELLPLTEGLNAMIVSERTQQLRYRNALGDLAHTLKTPLAVLRGIAERPQNDEGQKLLGEQVSRMRHIVDHQLKRAATAGARTLAEPSPLRPLVEKITAALVKVYANRSVEFVLDIPAALRLRADPGDLYELLGNLLDNACKYGKNQVRIAASRERNRVTLVVEDNGRGFPDDTSHLMERGARADTRQEGQGLGLGAVKDIVDAYDGRITLDKSNGLGGGRVVVTLSA
jgi:two-component system, OmpR family, sensor histidine kinase PhoQ